MLARRTASGAGRRSSALCAAAEGGGIEAMGNNDYGVAVAFPAAAVARRAGTGLLADATRKTASGKSGAPTPN
jgi:hypothetical protein